MMKEAEFNGNGSEMEYSFFTVAKIVPFVVKKIRNTDIFLVKEKKRIFFQKTHLTRKLLQIPFHPSIHL